MTDNTLDTQLNEIAATGANTPASPTTRPTASSSRMT